MINSMRRKKVSLEEINCILKLNRKGYSLGEINVEFWKRFSYARRSSTIDQIIKRESVDN